MLLNSSLSDVHLAAFTGNPQCYHSYYYRPNWTPLCLISITYYEKFQINYCWNRVLTIFKNCCLLELGKNATEVDLRVPGNDIKSPFPPSYFPRFDSVPVRKPKNVLQLENPNPNPKI